MSTTDHYIQAAETHIAEAEHANKAGLVNDMEAHLALADAYIGLGHLINETTTDDDDEVLSFQELMGEEQA